MGVVQLSITDGLAASLLLFYSKQKSPCHLRQGLFLGVGLSGARLLSDKNPYTVTVHALRLTALKDPEAFRVYGLKKVMTKMSSGTNVEIIVEIAKFYSSSLKLLAISVLMLVARRSWVSSFSFIISA